jgi:hypothetical protein
MGQIDLEDVSRDGRVLANHTNFSWEMIARAPGESKERELTWLGLSGVADLSRDGSKVLFTQLPEGGGEGGATYLRRTDGSPAVRLGDGLAQALSPDGKWALSILTSPSRLILLPTGVGQAKELTRPGFTYVGGAWFPDSRQVLFVGVTSGPPRTYAQDIDGGEPRAIGPEGTQRAFVTPDGRSLVAGGPDGKTVLLPVDGGESRTLAGVDPGEFPIGCSADGRSLYLTGLRGVAIQIRRLDLLTGRRELLHEVGPTDPAGVSTSPFAAISADGKSYAYSFIRNLSELYLVEGLK